MTADRRAVYVISVAAELSGVHPQTLRIYERKGLLEPGRTTGGSRRFSEADLKRLVRIQELTATGLNLEGVKRVLALEAEIARLQVEIETLRRATSAAVSFGDFRNRSCRGPCREHLVGDSRGRRRVGSVRDQRTTGPPC